MEVDSICKTRNFLWSIKSLFMRNNSFFHDLGGYLTCGCRESVSRYAMEEGVFGVQTR